MFLFPRLLSFDLSYDLDLWAEGQALRSFFIGTSFAIILYDGEFDQIPAQFLTGGMFFVPPLISLNFCYDLDMGLRSRFEIIFH